MLNTERLPPGPPLPASVSTWLWLKKPFAFQEQCQRRYGDTFTLRLTGLPAMVVVSDPALVREVFAFDGETLGRGRFNPIMGTFVGEGSTLMLKGKEHVRHRKMMLALMQGDCLAAHGRTMLDVAKEGLAGWPTDRAFSLRDALEPITLGIILRCIFGMKGGPALARMGDLVTRSLKLAAWPLLMYPALQKDYGRFSPWGRYVRLANEARAELLEIVRERRRAGIAEGASDVLSLLAVSEGDDGVRLTDEEIRDELLTTIVAGHETAATAIAWTLRFVLDNAPLRTELEAQIGSRELTPEHVGSLPLLDGAVREALRLQPVVPMLGRLLDRDVSVGDYRLPRGSGIICSIHLAHRRPSVYPQPLRFDARRFAGKKFSPSEFFPFGGGVHRCTGMAFSLYEMRMVTAAVLAHARGLRLTAPRAIRPVRRTVTIVPSGGPEVVLDRDSQQKRSA